MFKAKFFSPSPPPPPTKKIRVLFYALRLIYLDRILKIVLLTAVRPMKILLKKIKILVSIPLMTTKIPAFEKIPPGRSSL